MRTDTDRPGGASHAGASAGTDHVVRWSPLHAILLAIGAVSATGILVAAILYSLLTGHVGTPF